MITSLVISTRYCIGRLYPLFICLHIPWIPLFTNSDDLSLLERSYRMLTKHYVPTEMTTSQSYVADLNKLYTELSYSYVTVFRLDRLW